MAMRLEFLFVLAIGVVVVSNVNAEVIINGVNMGTYYLSAPNIEISNGKYFYYPAALLIL